MAERTLTPAGVPTTYAQLRDAVISVVIKGRDAIDRAWVETYHETGRLIHEDLLLKQDRAAYGASVFERLMADTEICDRTLRQCVQFYRRIPILHRGAKFNWAKYRLFCQVEDEAKRTALMTAAAKNDWATDKITAEVRAWNAASHDDPGDGAVSPPELLTPRRGTPGLHLIVDRGAGPVVDLGFMLYRDLTGGQEKRLAKGDIVRLDEAGVRKVDDATTAQLFTYAATVRRVIDGDTLVATVMVAPGYSRELKLRLRGLDCPEMSTAAGRAAKRFVNELVHAGNEVVISTTKPDKYDRYLADVFLAGATGQSSDSSVVASAKEELFLNNALLENGHAVRYDGVGPKEG